MYFLQKWPSIGRLDALLAKTLPSGGYHAFFHPLWQILYHVTSAKGVWVDMALSWQVHSTLKSPHTAACDSKQTANSEVQDSTIGYILSTTMISCKTKKFRLVGQKVAYVVIDRL